MSRSRHRKAITARRWRGRAFTSTRCARKIAAIDAESRGELARAFPSADGHRIRDPAHDGAACVEQSYEDLRGIAGEADLIA